MRSGRMPILALAACLCALGVTGGPKPEQREPALDFNNAPLTMVLEEYARLTDRTLLKAQSLPAVNITLRNQTKLTVDEALQAMDTVLAMHQIALLKDGDKFLRVVPIAKAREEPMAIAERPAEGLLKETGELRSLMIPLKHIDINEATKAVKPFQHSTFGQVAAFERINSILVTDIAGNLNRIMQVLKYVDQPVENREEPHVINIRYAKAADVKKKLEEIIADSQKAAPQVQVSRPSMSGPPVMVREAPPGVMRPPRIPAPGGPGEEAVEDLIELAERGVIRGKVKIVADDRTNVLIIITRHENMVFFEKIVKVLDVETEPEVTVKIIRLEYADAEKVAATLNTLIGGGKEKPGIPAGPGGEAGKPGVEGADSRSAALQEYLQRVQESMKGEKEKSKIGELSASDVKILPDKRTNSLLLMGSKADLVTLEELIRSMDTMLSQVLIEVVIFKITLNNSAERGIDWVQRAMVAYDDKAGGGRTPRAAYAGAVGGDKYRGGMIDPLTATTLSSMSSAAGNLTYYFTFFRQNVDAIVKLMATDNRTKILSSPVILTTDNKEAKISVTKEKYFYKGQKFVSTSGSGAGEWVDDVEMKRVGTKLTVTPHINLKKHVVMDISQSLEEEGSGQEIRGAGGLSTWPTIDSSDITAQVAVRNGETIVLGGLVSGAKREDESRVPILGRIPILGSLFKYWYKRDDRTEVIVFITPYVVDTPEEIEAETTRRNDALKLSQMWPKGWSDSKLANPKRKALEAGKKEAALRTELEVAALVAKEQALLEREKALEEKEKSLLAGKSGVAGDAAAAERAAPLGGESRDLDPELLKFIAEQDAKWVKAHKEVDAYVNGEVRRKAGQGKKD